MLRFARMGMTRGEKALTARLSEVTKLLALGLNVEDVDPEFRKTHLELAIRHMITGEVLRQYVLMDEHLSAMMATHFFGWDRSFLQLWRTKTFRAFNYFILEKLYLLAKLDFVAHVYDVPQKVNRDLRALNDLRNALAHSFFPENRRVKPGWKRQDIFSMEELKAFRSDMSEVADFFLERSWRRRRKKGNPAFG